jgi:hypothetical protein
MVGAKSGGGNSKQIRRLGAKPEAVTCGAVHVGFLQAEQRPTDLNNGPTRRARMSMGSEGSSKE